jgi:hypothetical protein
MCILGEEKRTVWRRVLRNRVFTFTFAFLETD